jgi:poly-gamma-glutamate synthesis protein (capsule biosynthesis protein)
MRQLLRGVDTVLGNLEGPIVARKITGDAPQRFGFDPSVAGLLSSLKINLVSLANNHALDQGPPGLAETRRHLRKADVRFIGAPSDCGPVFVDQEPFVFLGFNEVGRKVCSLDALARAVGKTRAARPRGLIVVTIHWGSEYVKTHTWWQEELAHALVDAGADLVVGHHPHVVQDIELYRGRLVLYSLGNFIFDQYFPADTRQGLAVGLTAFDEAVQYCFLPFQSSQSQPKLMDKAEASAFLSDLARASSPELSSGIERGGLVLGRQNGRE